MLFNTSAFFVFFIVFFNLYWLSARRKENTLRNILIILSSYIFYGWWDWRFLGLIILSSTVDYCIGLSLQKSSDYFKRKLLLLCSVVTNLGILGLFKYYNFFIDSLNNILQLFNPSIETSTLNVILPVGISFYTFQTMSYTIDVFNKKIQASTNPISFFSFVAFFPQLVAGPIERAQNLLVQFDQKKTYSYDDSIHGLRLTFWGLFKKVVIADNLAFFVDRIFESNLDPNGLNTIVGALLFAGQIYCDFSGYSDMAIGLAKMLGFDLQANFKTPYFSKSFREFWRRWHISLSTWFRDYVYIPLGGNKGSDYKIYNNVLITFLLSGLWHGAHITFLLWGGFHGILLVLERISKRKSTGIIYPLTVFLLITLLWIPFRAETYFQTSEMFYSLFIFSSYSLDFISNLILEFSTVKTLLLLIVFSTFLYLEYQLQLKDFHQWIKNKQKTYRWATYYFLIMAIMTLMNYNAKPSFIYFQF